jgi:hypothetical protein
LEAPVSAPPFNILTQNELTIDLSRPAMLFVVGALDPEFVAAHANLPVQCELDNLRNTLLNLLERSEPKPGNLDLIGG